MLKENNSSHNKSVDSLAKKIKSVIYDHHDKQPLILAETLGTLLIAALEIHKEETRDDG